jgi:hypothetical protein
MNRRYFGDEFQLSHLPRFGGTRSSGYIQKLIAEDKIDLSRIVQPSKYLVDRYRKEEEPQKVRRKLRLPLYKDTQLSKDLDIFLERTIQLLNSKSTRDLRAFKAKYPEFDSDRVERLFGSQKGTDFYPTPVSCIDKPDINRALRNAERILEPSAGMGALAQYALKLSERPKNKLPSMEMIELNTGLASFLKDTFEKNGLATVRQENFIEDYPIDESEIDTIICNPPFSSGSDKKFYLDFLFKCLAILVNSKAKGNLNLIFICPRLISNSAETRFWKEGKESQVFDFRDVVSNIGFAKLQSLLKLIGETITKKEFDEYKANEEIEAIEKITPFQSLWVDSCSGFGGTGVKADVYIFTFAG